MNYCAQTPKIPIFENQDSENSELNAAPSLLKGLRDQQCIEIYWKFHFGTYLARGRVRERVVVRIMTLGRVGYEILIRRPQEGVE